MGDKSLRGGLRRFYIHVCFPNTYIESHLNSLMNARTNFDLLSFPLGTHVNDPLNCHSLSPAHVESPKLTPDHSLKGLIKSQLN